MNLIICTSPLQVLISEKIIDLYPNDKFYGVFFAAKKSEKYQYYYERLKKKCNKSIFFDLENMNRNKYFVVLYMFFIWIYSMRISNVNRIFLANIEKYFIYILIGRFKNAEVITFDDGAINLNFSQNFFNKPPLSKLVSKKILFLLKILNATSMQDILKRKVQHYSIYTLPNVMGTTTYIDLFDDCKDLKENKKGCDQTISILVGQPIFQDMFEDESRDVLLMKKIISDFQIDYYFPHPRERFFINNIRYINTSLMFEEYIIQSIKENPSRKYVIYTLFSSIAFHLMSFPQVKIISLKPKNYSGIGDEVYNLFSHCGIRIESIEINE